MKALQNTGQPVTVNHLLAADSLMNVRGSLYEKLIKQQSGKEDRKEKLEKAMESVREGLTSKEEAGAAYEKFQMLAKEFLSEDMQNAAESVNVKERKLLFKQLSVAAGFAKDENYEVPVQIDGQWTSINLKIIRGGEASGRVTAAMETERYGKVTAQFEVYDKQVKGSISSDQAEGLEELLTKSAAFETALAGANRTVSELRFLKVRTLDSHQFTEEVSGGDGTAPTKELYDIAKAFITVLQQKGELAYEN